MMIGLEFKKLKKTGYAPAFLAGGLLAGAFPVVNMAFRSEMYLPQPGNPLVILTEANWQMMAMLNILLAVCGACIMYHTEYTDNGILKMNVLPIRPGSIFLGKFIAAVFFCAGILLLETAALSGCAMYWFPGYDFHLTELAAYAGFGLLLMLPTILIMLVIASGFQNLWLSLGIGVILVFLFSILPQDNAVLPLCPFSSPYYTLFTVQENGETALFSVVCGIETLLLAAAGIILQKFRRCFA